MPPPFDPRPCVLTGRVVRLEPLTPAHAPAVFAAGRDPTIWRWMLGPPLASPADAVCWIDEALAAQTRGTEVPFATVLRATGEVVGSTRFLDIRRPHRALEIGYTWVTPAWQRTAINTEAKFLLLRHAFEDLGAVRVQLKTDRRNENSQRAIARLGAVREGVLRCYQTCPDGYVRDTVMFSITAGEWPAVRDRLERRLAAGSPDSRPPA
jgi:RimJ/RimL family protein N-acetyltransferase